MIFNGHTPQSVDDIDEETFSEIQVMYADGIVGNKRLVQSSAETNVLIYNYLRGKNQNPYKISDFLGRANAYIFHEPTVEEQQQAAVSAWVALLPTSLLDKKGMKHGRESGNV